MESKFILPFALRFLPSLVMLAMAFYSVNDKKSRERWTQLLYQAGSLRPDQRDDPQKQAGVKVPFFVLSFIMLFLPAHFGPVSFYMWVTAKPEVVSNLKQRPVQSAMEERAAGRDSEALTPIPEPTPTPGLVNPPMPGQPGQPAPPAPSSVGASPPTGPRGLAPHMKP